MLYQAGGWYLVRRAVLPLPGMCPDSMRDITFGWRIGAAELAQQPWLAKVSQWPSVHTWLLLLKAASCPEPMGAQERPLPCIPAIITPPLRRGRLEHPPPAPPAQPPPLRSLINFILILSLPPTFGLTYQLFLVPELHPFQQMTPQRGQMTFNFPHVPSP